MRLIDADAIKLEKGFFENVDNVPKFFEWLGKQPTIDAVPVVRCRDCKHRYDDGYCEVWGDSFYYWEEFDEVPEDMFCGYGERREDGEEHNHDTD